MDVMKIPVITVSEHHEPIEGTDTAMRWYRVERMVDTVDYYIGQRLEADHVSALCGTPYFRVVIVAPRNGGSRH